MQYIKNVRGFYKNYCENLKNYLFLNITVI